MNNFMSSFSNLEINTFLNAARHAMSNGQFEVECSCVADAKALRRRYNELRSEFRIANREEVEMLDHLVTGNRGSTFTLRKPGFQPAVLKMVDALKESE